MIRQLLGIIGLQMLVAFASALGFGAAIDWIAGKSALIGGLIAVVPGAFYAWRVVRSTSRSAGRMLAAHVVAEFGKLALTALMFAAVFIGLKEVSVIPLFATYITTLMVYWVALMVFDKV